ncbi:hypothetical protein FGG08_001218 [Glutinoglossum americanum]|uniref:Uncharacterized protein n=1 Tax=Glutinoglossum americanum TaxID=1670608 RepID=A0A9P8IC18_9PEZI|nr:hypothetical protein FGG08_001218 [Glutinoglossum americanum]
MRALILTVLLPAPLLPLTTATVLQQREQQQQQQQPLSHFSLYKNSPFTPCTTNTSIPVLDTPTPLIAHFSQTRSPTHFCDTIHSSSAILPTALASSSFFPSWPSTLIQLLSILFSYFTLLRSLDASGDEGGKIPPPPYLLSLYPILFFDAARLVYWWVEFFRALRRLQTAPWLSTVLWVVPGFWWNQGIASGAEKARVYVAGVVTVVQMAASLGMVAVRWTHQDASVWNYLPLNLSSLGLPDACGSGSLPNDLFTDPRMTGARALQTVQFLLVAVGFVTRLDIGSARFPIMARRHGLVAFFVGTMVLSAVSLGIIGAAAGTPFRYTTGKCYVTVIMMDAKVGFFDVEFVRVSRVVSAFFGVY